MFLAVDQFGHVVAGEFKTMPVRDGVGWASLHAVSAEDAAVVINVIDARIALPCADSPLGGVLSRFYVNAIGRAGRGTQETGDTFFQARLVPL